ncbi:hypothetical protein DBV15_06565 [Temnothorax longispinosus]|uniref:Uncharacterized protein n=1 Tax=Temnothorax longispinosus TaxID=300112 RepID=A0A4S2KG68_9HYME|nr:hypothetical protein DBV15_06565 [Temnothorax longispinosus]
MDTRDRGEIEENGPARLTVETERRHTDKRRQRQNPRRGIARGQEERDVDVDGRDDGGTMGRNVTGARRTMVEGAAARGKRGDGFALNAPPRTFSPSRSVARSSVLPPQPPTAVTGVGLAPNSYKIDGREPDRRRERFPRRSTPPLAVSAAGLFPLSNLRSIPSIKEEERVARIRTGEREREGGRATADEEATTRRGLETRVTRQGERGGKAAHERGGEDAGARDAGRRSSATLHWQLHPSHTRYEPCSRATLHRDTRRTIVASAPTGGTSSSSIFAELVGTRVRRRQVPEDSAVVLVIVVSPSSFSPLSTSSSLSSSPSLSSSSSLSTRRSFSFHVTAAAAAAVVVVVVVVVWPSRCSLSWLRFVIASVTRVVPAVKPGVVRVVSGALVSQLAFDYDCVHRFRARSSANSLSTTTVCTAYRVARAREKRGLQGGARGISGVAERARGSYRPHVRRRRQRLHTPAHTDTQHRGPVVQLVARPCKGTPAHCISGVEGVLVFEKGGRAGREKSASDRISRRRAPNERAPATPGNTDEEGEDGNTARLKLEARRERTFSTNGDFKLDFKRGRKEEILTRMD